MKLNIVPARSGIQWVKLGAQAFMKQPLGLTGLTFMFGAIYALLVNLGAVGAVALGLLTPAGSLAMFVATERVTQGQFPLPSVFAAAFRNGRTCTRAILMLGAIHIAILLGLFALVTLLSAGPLVEVTQAADGNPPQVKMKPAFLLLGALQLPLLVLFAYAPALVYWHGLSATKSLFFSLVAFWRNLRAFITYSAAWVLILSMVLIGLSLLAGGQAALLVQFFAPFSLVLLAMMFTSLYFSFRDSFIATPPDPQPPPATPGPL